MNLRWSMAVLLVLAAAVVVMWWPRQQVPDVLQDPPVYPILTAEELAALPDQRLLERVEQECLRRMCEAHWNYDWRAGTGILPEMARALWAVSRFEDDVRIPGFVAYLRMDADTNLTRLGPTLVQAAEAYALLGMSEIATVLREAAGLDPGSTGNDDRLVLLEEAYRKMIGHGTGPRRLAIAKVNRTRLMQ